MSTDHIVCAVFTQEGRCVGVGINIEHTDSILLQRHRDKGHDMRRCPISVAMRAASPGFRKLVRKLKRQLDEREAIDLELSGGDQPATAGPDDAEPF